MTAREMRAILTTPGKLDVRLAVRLVDGKRMRLHRSNKSCALALLTNLPSEQEVRGFLTTEGWGSVLVIGAWRGE